MVFFLKSDEGVKEYKKINFPYPETVADKNYEEFLKKTSKGPDGINQTIILSVGRIQSSFVNEEHNKDIADDAVLAGEKKREYIQWNQIEKT